jgi:hypothetical protein
LAFLRGLSPEERILCDRASPDETREMVLAIEHEANSNNKSLKIAKRLDPLIQVLQQYDKIVTAYSQAYPAVMAPLWGSILLLIKVFHPPIKRK